MKRPRACPIVCALCGGPADPEDYCFGCREVVCEFCVGVSAQQGPHELLIHQHGRTLH